MAWTADSRLAGPGGRRVWRNTYTASGTTFAAESIPDMHGHIERIEWAPGSPAPDSSVDLSITTDDGINVLAVDTAGTGLDMSAAGTVTPHDANGNEILYPVTGSPSIGIANNSTSGAIVTMIVHEIVD